MIDLLTKHIFVKNPTACDRAFSVRPRDPRDLSLAAVSLNTALLGSFQHRSFRRMQEFL